MLLFIRNSSSPQGLRSHGCRGASRPTACFWGLLGPFLPAGQVSSSEGRRQMPHSVCRMAGMQTGLQTPGDRCSPAQKHMQLALEAVPLCWWTLCTVAMALD